MAHQDLPDETGYSEAEEQLGEIQALIGATVMAWSDLEYKMIALFAKLAECPVYAAGIIFYSQNSLKSQIGTIRKLAELNTSNSDDRREVMETLDKLSKLSKTRNKFVHSVYNLSYDPKKRNPRFEVVSSSFQSSELDLIKREKVNVTSMREHVKTVSLMSFQLDHIASKLSDEDTPAQRMVAVRAEQKKELDLALSTLREGRSDAP